MNTNTIQYMITQGLGYCCLYAFFRRNKQTGMIAARLGVTERAVRYHKEKMKNGEYVCAKLPTCLKACL
jgi:hypothetical protein